jgi:hypothetical protein
MVQARQFSLHAESQHTPVAQKPLAHSSAAAQGLPPALVGVHVPPLVEVSQYSPAAQSESWVQCMETQAPMPSQAVSPVSAQAVPFAAGTTPQQPPVQVATTQVVGGAGHDAALAQAVLPGQWGPPELELLPAAPPVPPPCPLGPQADTITSASPAAPLTILRIS